MFGSAVTHKLTHARNTQEKAWNSAAPSIRLSCAETHTHTLCVCERERESEAELLPNDGQRGDASVVLSPKSNEASQTQSLRGSNTHTRTHSSTYTDARGVVTGHCSREPYQTERGRLHLSTYCVYHNTCQMRFFFFLFIFFWSKKKESSDAAFDRHQIRFSKLSYIVESKIHQVHAQHRAKCVASVESCARNLRSVGLQVQVVVSLD